MDDSATVYLVFVLLTMIQAVKKGQHMNVHSQVIQIRIWTSFIASRRCLRLCLRRCCC